LEVIADEAFICRELGQRLDGLGGDAGVLVGGQVEERRRAGDVADLAEGEGRHLAHPAVRITGERRQLLDARAWLAEALLAVAVLIDERLRTDVRESQRHAHPVQHVRMLRPGRDQRRIVLAPILHRQDARFLLDGEPLIAGWRGRRRRLRRGWGRDGAAREDQEDGEHEELTHGGE
jgi:hypothetical protein